MELIGFGMRFSVMPQDTGENHVILCRVILGKREKVQAGSQQSYPSSAEFDTGVDDVSNPKWYIVWGANMNTHISPECVVSYKHSRDVPGNSHLLMLLPCWTTFIIVIIWFCLI